MCHYAGAVRQKLLPTGLLLPPWYVFLAVNTLENTEYHCWQRVWVANLQVFRDKACTVQRSQCAAFMTSRNCTPTARDVWQVKVGAWNYVEILLLIGYEAFE